MLTVAPKGSTKPETSEETPRFFETQRIVTGSVAELLAVDTAQEMASIIDDKNLLNELLHPNRTKPPNINIA
ncbi:Uncharacterised protein [Chlamydia trachomatis]|nr:Uncharacterised protein [Chlamydia trachomatis]CRH88261.1 Uncharacterised protein [Chlamydia trachomatis]